MRILVVNPILYTIESRRGSWKRLPSIKDTMIYGMCEGFRSLGHEVTLAACADYAPETAEEYDFNVVFFKSDLPKIALPSRIPYSREFSRWLRKKHKDFDMVVAGETFQMYTLACARICPRKTVIWQEMTSHQTIFHSIPSHLWHNIIAPIAMHGIIGVIPRTERSGEFIRKYLPDVCDTAVNHGIDSDKFSPSAAKKCQVIASTRLVPTKGIDKIIRIFAELHKTQGYEDIRLIIAGDGEERANLERLVINLGLESCVEFTGFLPRTRLGRLIAESLAFLACSSKDLNMVSIPESVCSGTPVLTNKVPAIAPWLNESGTGIARDDWNVSDLCEIIDKADSLSARCREVRHTLTAGYAAQKIIDLAQSMKNAGKRVH